MNTLAVVGLNHVKNVLDDTSSNTFMEGNEEIISRLKFISYIQKDEKIDVRHVNRQANTIYTKISRSLLYPDNRAKSLKFVKEVVSRTFDIIESHIHHQNYIVCKSIVSDLLKAKQGIINLKHTYIEDTKFCCDMDVVIEQIANKINLLKQQYPLLFDIPSPSLEPIKEPENKDVLPLLSGSPVINRSKNKN